jgi:metallo-beta-lactamase class B
MTKKLSGFLTILMISIVGFGQTFENEILNVSNDLRLIKLTDNSFIHESFFTSEKFGRFGSNGMILIDNGKAFLFDTPMTDSVTIQLLDFIEDSLRLEIVGFIANDWHSDSMEGLDLIIKKGIKSYSNEMTRKINSEKGLPIPEVGFIDSLTIQFGDYELICRYHGAAHTFDNIVVWIPKEKILFADCMIKETRARNLGFTGDGDLNSYPSTLKKVRDLYSDAKYVIPGHGRVGGIELIDHTIELTKR